MRHRENVYPITLYKHNIFFGFMSISYSVICDARRMLFYTVLDVARLSLVSPSNNTLLLLHFASTL